MASEFVELEFLPDVTPSCLPTESLSGLDLLDLIRADGALQSDDNLSESSEVTGVRVICQACGLGCFGQNALEQHNELHYGAVAYRCAACKTSLSDSFQFLLHMRLHVQGSHVCCECGCAFRTHSSLAMHFANHSPMNLSIFDCQKCGICNRTFASAAEFQTHLTAFEEVGIDMNEPISETHSLPQCDTTLKLISEHAVENYSINDSCQILTEVLPVSGSHACMICHQTFSSHDTLFRHCLIHPLIHIVEFGLPTCGVCRRVFQDVVELHQHVEDEAGVAAGVSSEPVFQNGSSGSSLPGSVVLDALRNALNVNLVQGGTSADHVTVEADSVSRSACDTDKITKTIEDITNAKSLVGRNNFKKSMTTKQGKNKERNRAGDDASYVCNQCRRSFLNAQGLLCHMKMHAEGKPYRCEHCGDCFRFPKRLAVHARVFHEVYLCSRCSLDSSNCTCESQESEDLPGKRRNAKDSAKLYTCLCCKRVFTRLKAMQKHELTHIQDVMHVCDICGKRFHDRSQFSRHLALHNGNPHRCQMCQKVFSSDVILRDHMKTHSSERPISCNICGKHFKWRNALRVHLNKHYGSTYQCYICGRDFTTKSYLMTHVEMHMGTRVRAHKCNLCEKAYFDKSALRKHRSTHATVRDRPYECPECGKGFLANNNLQTHLKLHRNERLYKCTVCGKSFNMKGHLKRHLTIHGKQTETSQDNSVLLLADEVCQETCEEVVIDSVVAIQ